MTSSTANAVPLPLEGKADTRLLNVLGQIALALIAVNENLDTIAAGSNATIERQGAVLAELGKITGQLKTLNNAVWNR